MDRTQWFSLGIAIILVLAIVPGSVLAAERMGGTVVVERGETVRGDLRAVAGTVVVRGNVTGDLQVSAGSVVVTGTVDGDVMGTAGSVQIDGRVGGSVQVASGSLSVGQHAVIEGGVDAGVGSARIDGTIRGTARIGGETITVGPAANIGGDLVYDGDLQRASSATVGGTVRHEPDLVKGPGVHIPALPTGAELIFSFLANFALGALLLLAFPNFTDRTVTQIQDQPGRSGAIGLLLLIAIPIVAVLAMVTVIGIPIGLLTIPLYIVLLWTGFVLCGFALGSWVLSRTETESRWGALGLGLAVLVVLGAVPIVGALLRFIALVIGFGGLLRCLRDAYVERRTTNSTTH